MVFRVHRAQRADALAEALAGLLAEPLPDPFARELVIVPARGVERWLSQRLSHRLGPTPGQEDGVCAGVEFRSPGSLVAELTGTRDAEDPWAPDALVWPLLALIDDCFDEEWCRPLADHLGRGRDGEEAELRRGRRYAVARRLARLFASYAVQRPALLEDWEAGRDSDGAGGDLPADLRWQAELWRRLAARVDAPTPCCRHAAVVERLQTRAEPGLPPRLSLFGHTRLPATEVELLRALGEHHDVHLWLPHPSPALWDALAAESGPVRRADDTSHAAAHHPLLASLGRDVRELERNLVGVPSDVVDAPAGDPPADEPQTLLARLQADIAANRVPERPREPSAHDDDSISVHSCHGPARQVEVLREVLLGLLADDPTLEPRDILVMCPDIESYAPLVSAVFGLGEVLPGPGEAGTTGHDGQAAAAAGRYGHPGQHLRVRLADRSLTQTNPLLAVAVRLLDIAGGRAEASAVLDLLALPPVRRRFGLSDADLERVAHWVEVSGVRWAFDAEHRSRYGLDAYLQNTWRFGLDRLLTGVAASDDAGRWFGTALPVDDVSSTDIDLVGRLTESLDRLRRVTDALAGAHSVEHWLGTLADGIGQLTAVGRDEQWQSGQVQRELTAIGVAAQASGRSTELRLPDVRALLDERFAGRPTRANFRTGTLTVCTMVPMRSVPHRVVVLLGLDDGAFPRGGAIDGDDVLTRDPLTGERDSRSEDRQLMLDAVLAARQHLVVTYTGASESTGRERPPAVPLKELLDALDRTEQGAATRVTHEHPLQAFDPANFAAGGPRAGGPFSFDRAALAGARAASGPRVTLPPLVEVDLPPPTGDISLDDFVAFFKHPVGSFLRRRLDIALRESGDEIVDTIPTELDGLREWQVGDRMLRDLLLGREPEQALAMEWRRGALPPGQLGWRLAKEIMEKAKPVALLVEASAGGVAAGAEDVEIELDDGRRLVGTATGLHDRRLVRAGYSRLGPKQQLEAWVTLVALEAALPGRGWSAGAIGRARGSDPAAARVVFPHVENADEVLAGLVALYDAGMRGPLPMPLKTAHEWACRRVRRADDDACRYKAQNAWSPGKWDGENADAAHELVWGARSPIDVLLQPPRPGEEYADESTRLGALAMRLWQPILATGVAS